MLRVNEGEEEEKGGRRGWRSLSYYGKSASPSPASVRRQGFTLVYRFKEKREAQEGRDWEGERAAEGIWRVSSLQRERFVYSLCRLHSPYQTSCHPFPSAHLFTLLSNPRPDVHRPQSGRSPETPTACSFSSPLCHLSQWLLALYSGWAGRL